MTNPGEIVVVPPLDDHSTTFGRVRRSLGDNSGRSYQDVRAGLKPRWWQVWLDLGLNWLVLGALVAGLLVVPAGWPIWGVGCLVGAAALGIGLLVHRIGHFVHEAVHMNLAPGKVNDVLANVAAGALTLTDVRAYRPIHLGHHRYLGTTRDTERSYFERLDLGFLIRAATGLHAIQVLRLRAHSIPVERSESDHSSSSRSGAIAVPLAGAVLHLGVAASALATGHWPLATAWVLGVGSVYPTVQSARQLLEHRSDSASGSHDYTVEDHGALTRMFEHAASGFMLGGVGFNRHLLHHWDAGVSYTRLGELEDWLSTTNVAGILSERQTTYAAAFLRLWSR